MKSIRHDVHVVSRLQSGPDDQLAAPAHAVGVIFPRQPAIANFLDHGGERIALKRGHQRAERAGVLGLDLVQGKLKARQIVIADLARLVIRDEQLGDAGVVEHLDPFFAQIALEPGPGDIKPLVHAACEMNFPGGSLARLQPARLADQEFGRHFLRRRIGQGLAKKPLRRSPSTACHGSADEHE